jgi:hypothetical protein
MPSRLEIDITEMPDGNYKTILTNPIDDSLVFTGGLDYLSGLAGIELATVDISTALTGFVIDNELTHIDGAIITGVTIESLNPGVTIVFINLESAASASYSLSAPWVVSGDFTFEVDYCLTSLTGSHALSGGSNNSDLFRVDAQTNSMTYRIGGVVYTTTGSYVENLKLNTAKMVRSGTTIKIFRNNAEIDSRIITLADWNILLMGIRDRFDPFNGIISKARLSNTSIPANSLEFELNNLTGNTEVNNGVTLTYVNIAETDDVRNTYLLSGDGTQWVSDLRTIEIASQA